MMLLYLLFFRSRITLFVMYGSAFFWLRLLSIDCIHKMPARYWTIMQLIIVQRHFFEHLTATVVFAGMYLTKTIYKMSAIRWVFVSTVPGAILISAAQRRP